MTERQNEKKTQRLMRRVNTSRCPLREVKQGVTDYPQHMSVVFSISSFNY